MHPRHRRLRLRVLHNRFHLILRIDRDRPCGWSGDEVATLDGLLVTVKQA
jgi:hypothetical protein